MAGLLLIVPLAAAMTALALVTRAIDQVFPFAPLVGYLAFLFLAVLAAADQITGVFGRVRPFAPAMFPALTLGRAAFTDLELVTLIGLQVNPLTLVKAEAAFAFVEQILEHGEFLLWAAYKDTNYMHLPFASEDTNYMHLQRLSIIDASCMMLHASMVLAYAQFLSININESSSSI